MFCLGKMFPPRVSDWKRGRGMVSNSIYGLSNINQNDRFFPVRLNSGQNHYGALFMAKQQQENNSHIFFKYLKHIYIILFNQSGLLYWLFDSQNASKILSRHCSFIRLATKTVYAPSKPVLFCDTAEANLRCCIIIKENSSFKVLFL